MVSERRRYRRLGRPFYRQSYPERLDRYENGDDNGAIPVIAVRDGPKVGLKATPVRIEGYPL